MAILRFYYFLCRYPKHPTFSFALGPRAMDILGFRQRCEPQKVQAKCPMCGFKKYVSHHSISEFNQQGTYANFP